MATLCQEMQKVSNEGAYFVIPSQLHGVDTPASDRVLKTLEECKSLGPAFFPTFFWGKSQVEFFWVLGAAWSLKIKPVICWSLQESKITSLRGRMPRCSNAAACVGTWPSTRQWGSFCWTTPRAAAVWIPWARCWPQSTTGWSFSILAQVGLFQLFWAINCWKIIPQNLNIINSLEFPKPIGNNLEQHLGSFPQMKHPQDCPSLPNKRVPKAQEWLFTSQCWERGEFARAGGEPAQDAALDSRGVSV